MNLDDAATLSVWSAIAALGALALKVVEWTARTIRAARAGAAAISKSDAEVGRDLRDELRADVDKLRGEVNVLTKRSDDCDERAKGCEDENEKLRGHAEAQASRISSLEDTVQILKDGACPVLCGTGTICPGARPPHDESLAKRG